MAIVKMNKFNLLAFKSDISDLLDILQGFNYVHFNDLKSDDESIDEVSNSKALSDIDSKIDRVNYAIDLVRRAMSKADVDIDDDFAEYSLEDVIKQGENFDFDLIYDKLRKLDHEKEELKGEKNDLANKIKALRPWQDIGVNLNDLYESERVFVETGTIASQFYEDLRKTMVQKSLDESLVMKVYEEDKTAYLICLSTKEEENDFVELLREYGYSRVRVNSKGSIKDHILDLSESYKFKEKDLGNVEKKILDFGRYLKDFNIYQAYLLNMRKKEESNEFFLATDQTNLIEGYIPSDYENKFVEDLDRVLGQSYILDIKEADRDDSDVPIILKNNKLVDPYEEVVKTYSLPKYNELDPSSVVAVFYTIFTGFMIGDLGYGLLAVIGILAILKLKKFPKETEKMLRLFLRISISACVFGFIFGSVFGGAIDVPFGRIDTQNDISTLITISLVIGGISLFTGLGLKAYMQIRDGKPLDAFYDVGFMYMTVGGALVFILKSSKIAMWIMIIGIIGIFLFAGREAKSIGGRIGSGAYEVYGLTSWIGDFVSFLRLMALVLSGSFVAYSVNLITGLLFGAGFVGIIGGILVFIVFQLFNMFLSYLSAYVHGLRLIYVEMFNKFYEGGGVKFREMVEDTKFVKIIRGGDNE